MDVRCEKCGTDYELDDARVKPAGVNVQCTSCGHVFRVRRHSITNVGVGGQEQRPSRRPDTVPDQPPMLDEDDLPAGATSNDTIPIPTLDIGEEPSGPHSSRPLRMTPSSARARARGGKERNWLVRLPGGEIETCRELATLHQWIIWGKVTRSSGISRSGKTWKRLGDIKELESFFEVAEESRRVKRQAMGGAGKGTDDEPDDEPDDRSDDQPGDGRASGQDSGSSGAIQLKPQPVSRVIGPIPDSFSASGPVSGGSSGAWPAQGTAGTAPAAAGPGAARESAPSLQPAPPVLPAGAPAADLKRTLRGVPTPASRSSSQLPSFGDDDDGPTQEVDIALPMSQPEQPRWAAAAGEPDEDAGDDDEGTDVGPEASPEASIDASPEASIDVSIDLSEPGDEPGDEPSSNPLDQRLSAAGPGADQRFDRGFDQISATESMEATIGDMGDEPTTKTPALTRPGAAAGAASQDQGRGEHDGPGTPRRPLQEAGVDPFDGPRRLDRAGLAHHAVQDGTQGPSAGMARRSALHDVAFAGGRIRPLPEDGEQAGDPRAASPDTRDSDTHEATAPSSGVGRWIVIAALILMAASATVVYLLVFRPTGETVDVIGPGAGDAGAELAAGLDGGIPGEPAQPDERTETVLALARTHLAADTRAGLESVDQKLAAAGDDDAAVLAARARVHTALAQHLLDGAALAGSAAGEKPGRDAKALVLAAHTLAQRALQIDRTKADALVAMADVQRLQGQRARQVESYLKDAFAQAPEHREARLVRAMTMAASERERDRDDAREIFEALARSAGTGERDVRPIYRMALLDLAESHPDDARRRAQEVLAAQSAHEGARALIARLDANPAVDTGDPMPPEETPADGPGDDRGGSGKDGDDDERGGSYDSLVSRAASKAKAGKCGDAMDLYERALDADPSGVAALMGMAECHLDRKEFASAHGKFQAALGVSPGNADALWGMAETYRKQGNGPQAVSWYRRYLEEHPSGSRASRARQRIDELDGGSQSPPANPSNGSGGGSGSGSGGGSGSGDAPAPGGGEPTPPAGNNGTEPPAGSPPAGAGADSP
jgi:predicted Zn finger-like uncharacterized protein